MNTRRIVALGVLVAAAAGCSASVGDDDLEQARGFRRFPLYWTGEKFERWRLTAIDGLRRGTELVTFVYGDCTPHGDEQPSCSPPIQIQVFPLCAHLDAVTRAPIWRRRSVRGAPVGTIDSAPVLFTSGAQVKVYRGEGADPGAPMRALRALRSLNHVPPVIAPTGRIPSPAPGVLAGTRPCSTPRA